MSAKLLPESAQGERIARQVANFNQSYRIVFGFDNARSRQCA